LPSLATKYGSAVEYVRVDAVPEIASALVRSFDLNVLIFFTTASNSSVVIAL